VDKKRKELRGVYVLRHIGKGVRTGLKRHRDKDDNQVENQPECRNGDIALERLCMIHIVPTHNEPPSAHRAMRQQTGFRETPRQSIDGAKEVY
jgi:hypothetical protein